MARVPTRILVVVPALVAVYALVLLALSWLGRDLGSDVLLSIAGMAIFTMIGARIEDHQPGNTIGRVCLVVGATLIASGTFRVAAHQLDAQTGPLPPIGALLAVGSSAGLSAAMFLGQLMILSRFPDGRSPGVLGRLIDALLALALGLTTLNALRPGPIQFGWIEDVPNPLGVAVLAEFLEATSAAGFVLYFALLLGGLTALLRRYRGGSSVVRAQIRWFVAAASTSASLIVVIATDALGPLGWDLWSLSTLLTPIAVGIAILRYRLFDIDRIISRTISYAAVTAVLAGTFVTVNLALGSVVASATGGSTLAVAGSTLVAAALFQPLRRRVQLPIDRRFNRARFDAEGVLVRFADRVRDQVDLGTLRLEVLSAADGSLRPSVASLWLRTSRP